MEALLERESLAPAGAVDVENAVIRGVRVVGLISRNGRRYDPEALRRAVAAGHYENKAVNVDHTPPGERRSYATRVGKLVNVTATSDGIRGDLLLNPEHAATRQILWDAQFNPNALGLSHDASGRTTTQDGELVVMEIESVRSVDLVADPATTNGLFESMRGRFGGLPSWQDDPLPSGDFGKEREPELLCASWRDEAPREPEHEAALAEDYRQQQDQEAVERVRRWCADD